MDTQDRLQKIMTSIQDLPTIPAVAMKINQLLKSKTAGSSDIGTIIAKDQNITVKLLKLVNSSYYGLPRTVGSISDAVSYLGGNILSQIVLSIGVLSTFEGKGKSGLDRKGFWSHGIAVAALSKSIAKEKKLIKIPEEAFTAGLLHDLGIIAMDHAVPELYKMVLDKSKSEKIPLVPIEKDLLTVTHGQVGEWVARNWELPLNIIVAILYHHDKPSERQGKAKSDDPIVDVVSVADYMSHLIGFGFAAEPEVIKPDPEVFERAGFTEESAEKFAQGLKSSIQAAVNVLNE
jgi:HD-like signal output (HDOD) protein